MNLRRRSDKAHPEHKRRHWPVVLIPICMGVFLLSLMIPLVGTALCAAGEVGALVFQINKRD